jgi:hypothetical protein
MYPQELVAVSSALSNVVLEEIQQARSYATIVGFFFFEKMPTH